MFDLEREIQRWRRELLADRLNGSELDELDDHLRSDIEEQLGLGVDVRDAFEAASGRIGRGSLLKTQFDQASVVSERRSDTGVLKGTTVFFVAWTVVLTAVYSFSSNGTAFKTGGFLFGVAVLAVALVWAYGRRSRIANPTPIAASMFTSNAQHCLGLAREEARRLGHDFVGTEHMLLALTSFNPGIVGRIFERAGVARDAIRKEIEIRISGYTAEGFEPTLPNTPRLNKALRFAAEQAALDHRPIDAEQVLLGLLIERGGVAGQVLRNLGFSVEQVRSSLN